MCRRNPRVQWGSCTSIELAVSLPSATRCPKSAGRTRVLGRRLAPKGSHPLKQGFEPRKAPSHSSPPVSTEGSMPPMPWCPRGQCSQGSWPTASPPGAAHPQVALEGKVLSHPATWCPMQEALLGLRGSPSGPCGAQPKRQDVGVGRGFWRLTLWVKILSLPPVIRSIGLRVFISKAG